MLAMMCARAGADSVVAPELHEALVACARRNVAANGLSAQINVVERDIGLLERGREVHRRRLKGWAWGCCVWAPASLR